MAIANCITASPISPRRQGDHGDRNSLRVLRVSVVQTSYLALALGELEAAAGFGFAVFFALDDAAVAGQEALALQQRAQARLVAGQRLADAVAPRAGLAGETAALDGAPHIELAEPVGRDERLVDQHPQHRPREIDRALAAVDVDPAGAGLDPHPRHRVLALPRCIGAAEGVDLRLDIVGDRRGWNRRRRRCARLLARLAHAPQGLKGLRALRARWVVVGHV